MPKLTHARLTDVLDYAPETGVFSWKKTTSPRVSVGAQAGVIANNGRRYIAIDSEKFMAHRLAWFYVNGEWPSGDVRQKNGNFDDCRLDNLEDVSRSVAASNRALSGRNKSGYRGVSRDKYGQWTAFITRNYKQVGLGSFATAEEASAAYERAASEMEISVSPEDRAAAAERSAIRRRLRVAWGKLDQNHFWIDFDSFCSDVKDVPPRHSVVALDKTGYVGPGNFEITADLSTGFDLRTREGRIAYWREHRRANPDVYRDRELRKSYGITLADYDLMLEGQGGVCAICKEPETLINHDRTMPLAVDHCHDTKRVRGLLCAHCNQAIGKFDHDVALMEGAIGYLRKYEGRDA